MRIHALTVLLAAAVLPLAAGCIARKPNTQAAIALYAEGKVLADSGDVQAALRELEAAVKVDPSLSVAHATIGDIYRRQGDWEMARQSYEVACMTNPYAFKPHYNLGLTYQTLAKAAEAAEQIKTYLQKAVEFYLKANNLDPADFDTNNNLAACYFELGKTELAEKHGRAAVQANPNDAFAQSNLGIIYMSQERYYEAIAAYKASLEIDSHQPKVLLDLGAAYVQQNRLKQAIVAFELAAQETPNDPAPREQIASCQYRLGQYDQAEQAYLAVLRLCGETGSASAQRGLGVVYMTQFVLNPERTDLRDKGLAAWNASLELKPDQSDLESLVAKYTPAYETPKL